MEIDQCMRVGGFGPKIKNQAAGAQFSRTHRGGPLDWVEGTYLGRGELGLKGWQAEIDRCVRGGGFGWKIGNQAARAWFLRTNRGGA